MRIALLGGELNKGLLQQVKKTLDDMGVQTLVMKKQYVTTNDADIIIVLGGDRGLLHYFHNMVTDSPPVLGINEPDSTGFLAQIETKNLDIAINRLKSGDFSNHIKKIM